MLYEVITDVVTREQMFQGDFRLDSDVAGYQRDADVGAGKQPVQQRFDARIQDRLVPVEIRQCRQNLLAPLLAELPAQVVRKFAQPAKIS